MSFRKILPTIAILGDTVYDVDKLTPAERQWLFDALQAQDEQRGLVPFHDDLVGAIALEPSPLASGTSRPADEGDDVGRRTDDGLSGDGLHRQPPARK